jgi:hypothetical protein
MANPFVDTGATYTRTITDDRDDEKFEIVYRPLTAGDRAELQDLARMSTDQDEAGSAEMRLGAAQIITLERAIVSWNLPLSKTKQTIEALHPDLFDQIFSNIAWGSPPDEPDEAEDPTRQLVPVPETPKEEQTS